jgi:hypothetical protein
MKNDVKCTRRKENECVYGHIFLALKTSMSIFKWSNKNKQNTAKVCHLYFWSNNSALFEHWNWKSSFKHRGWYVFPGRKGVNLCSILFIFVASFDPLSKNKSQMIIQKCRNFCKQLTLPGRTVQQLPFFKTVRLYTVVRH